MLDRSLSLRSNKPIKSNHECPNINDNNNNNNNNKVLLMTQEKVEPKKLAFYTKVYQQNDITTKLHVQDFGHFINPTSLLLPTN